MGKAEGRGKSWHGHVSVLTVTPEFRRMGLARTCMRELERVSDATCVVPQRGVEEEEEEGRRWLLQRR
jgi:ribosomal protein S18 acetylase RimI-like enzyme